MRRRDERAGPAGIGRRRRAQPVGRLAGCVDQQRTLEAHSRSPPAVGVALSPATYTAPDRVCEGRRSSSRADDGRTRLMESDLRPRRPGRRVLAWLVVAGLRLPRVPAADAAAAITAKPASAGKSAAPAA